MAALSRTGAWAGGSTLLAILWVSLSAVRADDGLARQALPGADRVLTPVTDAAPAALAVSGGYGITESQSGEGPHHRLSGTAAASFAPLKQLALSLALDGRHDLHPGGDSSTLGSPQLNAVAGAPIARGVRLGGLLQWTVPGRNAPSIDFGASVFQAAALASWEILSDLSLAGLLGFRIDASAHAAPDVTRLSPADRMSLGLSDFHALPFGLALFRRLDRVELAGELSGEILVGSGAPALFRSPLRAAAIGRWLLLPGLDGEVLFELGLSDRPNYARTRPLIPIEPRASLSIGLRYAPPPPTAAAPAARPAPPAAPPSTHLFGHTLDADGEPLSGVMLALQFSDEARYAESGADGGYEFSALPRGQARLSAQAAGLDPVNLDVELNATEQELSLQLKRSVVAAQLRGLVRSFSGAPLSASVRVLPSGRTATADKDGRFVLELPAGEYQVEIECSGYLTQRRKISVQEDGVTLLNVELHEATR